MEEELERYLTAVIRYRPLEKIRESLYEILMKRELVYAAEQLMVPEKLWSWLDKQRDIPTYLYGLWMKNDCTLLPELRDILMDEIYYDMDIHRRRKTEQ